MPEKPNVEAMVLAEFKQYLAHKRGKRLAGYRKDMAPAAASSDAKCEACEKGTCDDPDHLDPEVLEKLGALAGDEGEGVHSSSDDDEPGE